MKLSSCVRLLLGATLLAGVADAAQPAPSITSVKAHKSLLLDVARAGDRLVAVGERGHVVLSDDQGASWRQAPVPVRSLLSAVYFVDERRGWAVGHDSVVLATTDGGSSWAIQHYKEFDPAAAEAAADEENLDESMEDDAWVDDGSGEGETREIGSREGVPLLDVWFSADGQRGLAVGAYGLLLGTRDGGKTWQDESDRVANRDGWHFNAIGGLPGNASLVVIAGEKGTLYRSLDGGMTFGPLASPYDGSFFGVMGDDSGALYAFGLQGRLYRSIDAGANWSRIETSVTSGLNDGCVAAGGSVVIAGNAGIVLSGDRTSPAFTAVRRADRQSVLSCVAIAKGVVLVGEGGARLAAANGQNP